MGLYLAKEKETLTLESVNIKDKEISSLHAWLIFVYRKKRSMFHGWQSRKNARAKLTTLYIPQYLLGFEKHYLVLGPEVYWCLKSTKT